MAQLEGPPPPPATKKGDMTKKAKPKEAGPEIITSTGVIADEPLDEEEVYQNAVREWRKTERLAKRRENQCIEFDKGPVCFVFSADQHLGDPGTDIERAFAELELVNETPGMYLVLLGDMVNSFVIGNLWRAALNHRTAITDEWALVRRYLRIAAPKLLAVVAGNHDFWVDLLAGIPYMREVVAQIRPACIFDPDDAKIAVKIGSANFILRMRHKWRIRSIYSATHGIEQAARFDQDFDVGVGAHNHNGAVVRTFSVGGKNKLAVQLGTYKVEDRYARQMGFYKTPETASAAVVFDEEYGFAGFDNIAFAAKFLRGLYE